MKDVDLIGIGSYTELPGGNVTLPGGFASLLNPIAASIPQERVVKGKPIKHIHWRYRAELEEGGSGRKNDRGYESSDSAQSDTSVKTVKSTASSAVGQLPLQPAAEAAIAAAALNRPSTSRRGSTAPTGKKASSS